MSVLLDKNRKERTIQEGVTNIQDRAFVKFLMLMRVVIPNSVTRIGSFAFQYCESLTDIVLPSSLTEIGNNAFQHCKSLCEITLPTGLSAIGDFAFYGAQSFQASQYQTKFKQLVATHFIGVHHLFKFQLRIVLQELDFLLLNGAQAFHLSHFQIVF